MMDLTFLSNAIVPVVLGICLIAGYLIKYYVKQIPNDAIPLIAVGLGVVLNIWVAHSITPEVLLAGMFSGLSSTGLYELLRNMINKNKIE